MRERLQRAVRDPRTEVSRTIRGIGRAYDNWREPRVRTTWPAGSAVDDGVAIVVVNFNTAGLLAQLVFSLYRVLHAGEFRSLVVVDNGSTDGSRPVLSALVEAGLVTHVVDNDKHPYHGPGLNRGFSFLAANQDDPSFATRWVVVMDSDVVALRPGGLGDARRALELDQAAIAGQMRLINLLPEGYAHVSLNVVDPLVVWRPEIPPFQEDGHPGAVMQRALRARGERIVNFPFYAEEYFLHLGRGTIRVLHDRGTESKRYPAWAQLGYDAHFEGSANGAARYEAFLDCFADEVTEASAGALIEACSRPQRLTFVGT